MFASLPCAYFYWGVLGLLGGHHFYLGRPLKGLLWMVTLGVFGVGWIIDFFFIPHYVEEHNKRVFHKQMLETGSSLLFDGDYGGHNYYYPGTNNQGYMPAAGLDGAIAPYSQHVYYPQVQESADTGYAKPNAGYTGAQYYSY